MRCKGASAASTVNPMGLCEKHLDEWTTAGCPPLDATSTEAPDDLAAVEPQVAAMRDTTAAYLQTISTTQLDSQQALDWLGQVYEGVKNALAGLEEKRTSITKPINEAKRKVDALFAPAKDGCKAVIKACEDRLNAYAAQQRATQDQALQLIEGGSRDDTTIAAAHLVGPSLPEQVDVRDEYAVEVQDFARVPDMFKVLDEASVITYAKSRHGRVDIPGLIVTVRDRVQKARA